MIANTCQSKHDKHDDNNRNTNKNKNTNNTNNNKEKTNRQESTAKERNYFDWRRALPNVAEIQKRKRWK